MEMKSTKMIIYECNEGDDKGKEKVKMTTMAMQWRLTAVQKRAFVI